MVGGFACPECGRELEVEGLAPGGLIRCEDCATWVEIPFLPRAPGLRRRRSARAWSPWEIRALRVSLALLVLSLIAAMAIRRIGDRVRSDHERVLAELIASADAAEAAGNADRALIEIEAAVARARSVGSPRLGDLLTRRASASLREAKGRLARVGSLDPDRAVGEALTLRDRARGDAALAPLVDAIDGALDAQRLRQAGAGLALARAALDDGRAGDAFAAAERLHARADQLQPADVRRFRTESEAVMEAAVARAGVATLPPSGRFAIGTPELYAARLDVAWEEALRLRGYLPQPRRSAWRGLWDTLAPYRATLEVAEAEDGTYLDSANRTTRISGTFRLECGDRRVWEANATGMTSPFPPNLTAYAGGRMVASPRRDPEVERRLYEDALAQFVERASKKLLGLPMLAASRDP